MSTAGALCATEKRLLRHGIRGLCWDAQPPAKRGCPGRDEDARQQLYVLRGREKRCERRTDAHALVIAEMCDLLVQHPHDTMLLGNAFAHLFSVYADTPFAPQHSTEAPKHRRKKDDGGGVGQEQRAEELDGRVL